MRSKHECPDCGSTLPRVTVLVPGSEPLSVCPGCTAGQSIHELAAMNDPRQPAPGQGFGLNR